MSRSGTAMAGQTAGRANVRAFVSPLASGVSAIFLLIGILGFIPGITTNYGDMRFAGPDSGAMLFGIFQTSVLQNFLYIVTGLVGLALARTAAGARAFLVGGGAVYLVLWLYGLAVGRDSPANFMPFNQADNWLHLLLGVGMIALGLAGTRSPART